MTKQDINLSKNLNTLPIDVGKVLLWLVYKDAKPMASIVTTFNWDADQKNQKKILDWLGEAKINFQVSQRFQNTLHVSKSEKILENNHKYELDETFEAHFNRGKFYGFPEEAAKIYAQNIIKDNDNFPPKELIHPALLEKNKRDQYWYPYIEYLIRSGHEDEDSQVAKNWAKIARADIPKIAKEYEKKRIKDLQTFRNSRLNS